MIGVIAHVIVLVVGWSASWLFPADTKVKTEWTFWGWLEKRRSGVSAAPGHALNNQSTAFCRDATPGKDK